MLRVLNIKEMIREIPEGQEASAHGLKKITGMLSDVVDLGTLRTALGWGNRESLVPPQITANIPKLAPTTFPENKSQRHTCKDSTLLPAAPCAQGPTTVDSSKRLVTKEGAVGHQTEASLRPPLYLPTLSWPLFDFLTLPSIQGRKGKQVRWRNPTWCWNRFITRMETHPYLDL